MPPTAIKHQLTCPFELTSGNFLIGRKRILVILRNHVVECSSTCSNRVNQAADSHLFIGHSEFITVQCKRILNRANNNEIKCFEFGSIKRALRPQLRTIIAE